jgi:hypothetical protein
MQNLMLGLMSGMLWSGRNSFCYFLGFIGFILIGLSLICQFLC